MSLRTTLKKLYGTAWHVLGDQIIDGMTLATDGTVEASKPVVADANKDVSGLRHLTLTGNLVVGSTTISETDLQALDGVIATPAEINRAADLSTRMITADQSSLAVTVAAHDGKTILLDRAAGIAVTLPAAVGSGAKFRFIVKTTFTSAASIKSATGADIMIGHALLGNDSDNAVVDWQSIAASTNDTIDLLGTGNSTGGMAGQVITIEDVAANLWFVEIRGDAAGTEASPFSNTVA